MKEMKRILSLVLCFAMFVGMLPMFVLGVQAAGDQQTVTVTNYTVTVPVKKTAYVPTDTITGAGTYLIASGHDSSIYLLAKKDDNNVQTVSVNTQLAGTDCYIDPANVDSAAQWTTTVSGTAYTIKNGSRYLRVSNGNVSLNRNSYNWNTDKDQLYNGSNYLYFDGSSVKVGTSGNVYLFTEGEVTVDEQKALSGTYSLSVPKNNVTVNVSDPNAKLDLSATLHFEGNVTIADQNVSANATYAYDTNAGIIAGITSDGTVSFTGNAGEATVQISYDVANGTVKNYVTITTTAPNNYPEYPDEGAVKVGKSGYGINFLSSGIAQVEVSASGVPMSKGIDIIVMLDLSSSMKRHTDCGQSSCTDNSCRKISRLSELQDSLIVLQNTLKSSENADDMKIAIADFNGFFGAGALNANKNTPYDRDQADLMEDATMLNTATSGTHRVGVVYDPQTGNTTSIGAGAFKPVSSLNMTNVNNQITAQGAKQGTNYDHAFDVVYQLGHAIKKQNAANNQADRELFVIFMSDGAPNQYNYYHAIGGETTTSGSSKWNNWLQGTWKTSDLTKTNVDCTDHIYYYDTNDHDGDGVINEHRMANAIKGDPNQRYEVIRKSNAGLTDVLQNGSKTNLYTLPGLGATMYSVGFYLKNDGAITVDSVKHVLQQIPSSADKYIEASQTGALDAAFKQIAGDILYAAYNARMVDQMGDDYNLKLGKLEALNAQGNMEALKDANGNEITNKIEIISYDVYTQTDADNNAIPTGKNIGDRKGTSTVLETITFNPEGTEAYSDKIYTTNSSGQKTYTNILGADGIIRAKSFYYNTKTTAVAVEDVSIPTGKTANNLTTGSTNMLPAETFYWMLGTITTDELAMRYFVYLDGSMEGYREAGTYPTNNYATLYYDNYAGAPCYKETVSPKLSWDAANVSYAFYLVDEVTGMPIVNQSTGATGSFANKIAVTNPVVFSQILMNSQNHLIDAAALANLLPEGYTLYDAVYTDGQLTDGPTYTINVHSNGAGSWAITSTNNNLPKTTYVTQYDPNNASAYSNAVSNNSNSADYTHTVVWFAVKWSIKALPDTVVIDYGLPVDINVLSNDMFGTHGKLSSIGETFAAMLNTNTTYISEDDELDGTYSSAYGTAVADPKTGTVRYTPANMEMPTYDRFAYSVNYTGTAYPEKIGHYYSTVTVIPATTIYYEENFLTLDSEEWKDGAWVDADASDTWWLESEYDDVVTQGEDRPGQFSTNDANNIYGYDGAYAECNIFSQDHSLVATVNSQYRANASFQFWGTGFDVISMTSNLTGTMTVKVYAIDANGNVGTSTVRNYVVDTYYGYTYDATNDKWVVDETSTDSIYQVPVMQVENLPYGHYKAVITAQYAAMFDHANDDGEYDVYLDAIRIYDPANGGAQDDDTVIEDAYVADHEGWPSYIELRDGLIGANSFGADLNTKVNGMVFIDGRDDNGVAQMEDYKSYGPNNEVYLDAGQSVAFILNTPTNIDRVHIGIKSADGESCAYTIKNIAKQAIGNLAAGAEYNVKNFTVETSTDMYYDLTSWKGDIIVITNNGAGIMSLTNIKSTYTTNPNGNTSTVPTAPTEAPSETPSEDPAATPSGTFEVKVAVGSSAKTLAASEPASESVLTSIYMTRGAAELVVASMNAPAEEEIPEETEPEVFEPETFEVKLNKKTANVGDKITVKVTTSTEVSYVTVNGQKITKNKIDKKKGTRTWEISLKAEQAGTMEVEVVAYNEEDLASNPAEQIVTVTEKSSKK